MSARIRRAVAGFFAAWALFCLIDAVTYLHVPNPVTWDPINRAMAMIFSLWAAFMAWLWARDFGA